MIRTARFTDACIEQAQVIVDFSDGANGGARIVRGGFLFDGNGRRQPLDMIDVRLFHHRQKLPRISRQRFHVAPLTFGVNGIERERRFTGTGQPRDHD